MQARPFERVVMIEFNELVPRLIDDWIADGSLQNFKALRDRSLQFVTEPDVASAGELEPWIQWYSIHTGLGLDQHGILHLTDGPRAPHKDMFDILGDAGFTLGCFGSMNVKSIPSDRGFFVADPWCDGQSAKPVELNTFQNFISQYVREYSNPQAAAAPVSVPQFLSFMMSHGLSARTVAQTLTQLARERLKGRAWSWRRAAILDRLCIDVFKHLYASHRPHLATFFANSTAHLQHSYWRHMEPAAYKVQPSKEQVDVYGGAIKYGYVMMDRLIEEIVSLTTSRDLVVFATALSQQPFLRKEDAGGQLFYRPRDVARLFEWLGVSGAKIEPVMTHQYRLRFESEAALADAKRILADLECDGRRVAGFSEQKSDGFIFGCSISEQIAPEAVIARRGSNDTMRFFDLFYQIDGMKSGCHHPDGILWLATGEPKVAGRCSILDIFPTILDALGRPDLVPSQCRGRSRLSPSVVKVRELAMS